MSHLGTSHLRTLPQRRFIGSSRFHFIVGYVVSVRDTKEFEEASHLHCLYPSFNVCCYGPRLTCIQKHGHGQGTHLSDLGARIVPDVS